MPKTDDQRPKTDYALASSAAVGIMIRHGCARIHLNLPLLDAPCRSFPEHRFPSHTSKEQDMRNLLRAAALFAICFSALIAFAGNTRHFTFRYEFTVKNVPAGMAVRI